MGTDDGYPDGLNRNAFCAGRLPVKGILLDLYLSALYGATGIIVLTVINIIGIREGKNAQNLLTAAKIAGLLLVAIEGYSFQILNQ